MPTRPNEQGLEPRAAAQWPSPAHDQAANDSDGGPGVLLASTCAWPSTPKLAIALSAAACRVCAISPSGHPLRLTSAVTRQFRYDPLRPLHSLKVAIKTGRPDLIIACDERAVEHLHRLHAQTQDAGLRALIERSLGAPDQFERTASRETVLALAQELGIPTPEGRLVETTTDLRAWGETQPFPWVMKIDGSWGGLGVRIVSNLAEAERAFAHFKRRWRPLYALLRLFRDGDPFWLNPWQNHPPARITLQRYIRGHPANCAVAAWQGVHLGGIGVEVVASDGETGPASVVRVAADTRMVEAGARIAEALGVSGLVGFDFLIEAASGQPFLLEMNPRATPICHLRLGLGKDLIGPLMAAVTGQPAPDQSADTACEIIALFPEAELQLEGHPILATAYHDAPLQEPLLMSRLLRRRARRRPTAWLQLAPAE